MHPPLTILMRYSKKPFTVTTSKGLSFVIPKAGPLYTSSCAFYHGPLVAADDRGCRNV